MILIHPALLAISGTPDLDAVFEPGGDEVGTIWGPCNRSRDVAMTTIDQEGMAVGSIPHLDNGIPRRIWSDAVGTERFVPRV